MLQLKQIQVELQETMGSDAAIANAAWTSTYDKSKREGKYDDPAKVAELVKRIITDGHGVPVESVILRFWMRLPIFTDRQNMTHRIASHNGLSGRYRTMPEDFYHIPDDVKEIFGKLAPTIPDFFSKAISDKYDYLCEEANKAYRQWLVVLKDGEAKGNITNKEYRRARELVRGVLPVAGMVERTTIMNLRSFANYQRLRNSDHAQPEIRFIAERMLEEVEKSNVCPVAIEVLKSIGWKV